MLPNNLDIKRINIIFNQNYFIWAEERERVLCFIKKIVKFAEV